MHTPLFLVLYLSSIVHLYLLSLFKRYHFLYFFRVSSTRASIEFPPSSLLSSFLFSSRSKCFLFPCCFLDIFSLRLPLTRSPVDHRDEEKRKREPFYAHSFPLSRARCTGRLTSLFHVSQLYALLRKRNPPSFLLHFISFFLFLLFPFCEKIGKYVSLLNLDK